MASKKNGKAAKTGKAAKEKKNPHMQARLAYLYKATTYLSTQKPPSSSTPGLARRLASQLRAVSLKSQLRLPQSVKRSLCNRCGTLLHGDTASVQVENASRDGAKPWADVLVIECAMCGAAKRFPVGSTRQPKKQERERKATLQTEGNG